MIPGAVPGRGVPGPHRVGRCHNGRMASGGGEELESARVARVLREEILHGDRAPGSRLIERDIAAALGVSRLPVREAIRKLGAEGIVVSRPRSWATVRIFTERDIEELGEVRDALEGFLFVLAARRHDEPGLARLRAVIEAERAAALRDDHAAAQDAAAEFHLAVTRLANNSAFDEIVSGTLTRLRWVFGQHDDLGGMVDEHEALYEAIAARDEALVRERITDHLRRGRVQAMRRLQALPVER